MLGFIIFASLLTYIIPHGAYERVNDPTNDYQTVVPGSYKVVSGKPVSFVRTLMTIPEGIIGRADLVVLILLVGGCFYVIDKTGAACTAAARGSHQKSRVPAAHPSNRGAASFRT